MIKNYILKVSSWPTSRFKQISSSFLQVCSRWYLSYKSFAGGKMRSKLLTLLYTVYICSIVITAYTIWTLVKLLTPFTLFTKFTLFELLLLHCLQCLNFLNSIAHIPHRRPEHLLMMLMMIALFIVILNLLRIPNISRWWLPSARPGANLQVNFLVLRNTTRREEERRWKVKCINEYLKCIQNC